MEREAGGDGVAVRRRLGGGGSMGCSLPKTAWIQEGRGVSVHVGVCQRECVHGMHFRFGKMHSGFLYL